MSTHISSPLTASRVTRDRSKTHRNTIMKPVGGTTQCDTHGTALYKYCKNNMYCSGVAENPQYSQPQSQYQQSSGQQQTFNQQQYQAQPGYSGQGQGYGKSTNTCTTSNTGITAGTTGTLGRFHTRISRLFLVLIMCFE